MCPSRFFFSSRRRHTRSDRDWSSDVCSSDLFHLVSLGLRPHVDPGNAERPGPSGIPGRHVHARSERHRAELVGTHDDLEAELLDERTLVEVALDGRDVTVPHPNEVGTGKRDGASGGRAAAERTRVGASHDPLGGDAVGIGDRRRRQVEGEIRKGREQRVRVGADRRSKQRPSRRRVAIRAAGIECCNQQPGFVLIPGIEIPLCDSEGAHGLAPLWTGTYYRTAPSQGCHMGISGRPPFRLTTLGALALSGEEGPLAGAAAQRRSLALLALLALGRTKGVSRDKLVAYLWPESAEERAHHALAQLLYGLRRDLGKADVAAGTNELRLNREVISVDLDDFEAALARHELERAVAAYGGPLLDGFHLGRAPEFERLVDSERADLGQRVGGGLATVAQGASGRGDHVAAARWGRRLPAGRAPRSPLPPGPDRAPRAPREP